MQLREYKQDEDQKVRFGTLPLYNNSQIVDTIFGGFQATNLYSVFRRNNR